MLDAIKIIGAGLAGSEAAWQIAERGVRVLLYEMRPSKMTPAHKTAKFAELVCSNSFKSDQPGSAPHLLKQELRRLGSLVLSAADACRVPAGAALAVDRELFAQRITEALRAHPLIEVIEEEVTAIPDDAITIIATGPLTSDALSRAIAEFAGQEHLYFYDAISPVVDGETIDFGKVFRASRYGKGDGDYLNCPMTEEEYDRFYRALVEAESVGLHEFEERLFFEGCLPIEELARRGRETLLYGPMKPVGLVDPRTGKRPFAVVQLRAENLMADAYNIVGFQNHLKFPEQKRVFRLIPGLERAEFLRYGQIHRNTYINSPRLLAPSLQTRTNPRLLFAGQITGVEGYTECIATGLMAGVNAARIYLGREPLVWPRETAMGSLAFYITSADPQDFQPANINFGLLPPLDDEARVRLRDKQRRRQEQIRRAMAALERFLDEGAAPSWPANASPAHARAD